MSTKIGLLNCIVLINLVAVNGFGLVLIKNKNEEQLIDKLSKILDETDSVDHKNLIDVRSARKDLHDAHKKFERNKLIKTYVPHGKVNFETNGEAIYKTLVKIHKNKKPIFIKDDNKFNIKFDIARSREPDSSEPEVNNRTNKSELAKIWEKLKALKNKYKKELKGDYGVDDNEKKHLRAFKDFFNRTKIWEGASRLWKKVKKVFQFRGEKKKTEKSISRKLSRLFDAEEREALRFVRSGEEHDPLAPGKIPFNIEVHEDTTQNAKQWLPSYSFWNYWTYDKTLHQDICKGNLIKVGNKCIGSPPH